MNFVQAELKLEHLCGPEPDSPDVTLDDTDDFDVVWDDEDEEAYTISDLFNAHGGLTAGGFELLAQMDAAGDFC